MPHRLPRLFVVILIACSFSWAVATSASASGAFDDDNGIEHESAINRIASLGITNGCNPPSNTKYCPSDSVTRGEMATFLVRTLGLEGSNGGQFRDTRDSAHRNDIDILAHAGITNGCNPPANDRFCPERPVTRGEMAAFIVRGLGLTGRSGSSFNDTTGHPLEGDISLLAGAGITNGCNPPANTQFCPRRAVTRAQMATFLDRTHDVLHGNGGNRRNGVSIRGATFYLDGIVTNRGSQAEGLLMNSRMVQAVIDIDGSDSAFRYPDTGRWDADRNTREFIAAIPSYVDAGLDAVTINLQGGNPLAAPVDDRPDWTISAYTSEGGLRSAWMERLDRVVKAADREGLAVIVGLFYFGQDHRLSNEKAVIAATDNVTDWVVDHGYDNVLFEICNECNVNYDHAILRPDRTHELMERVSRRSNNRIPVSASLNGGAVPSGRWIAASDYILLHGNRQNSGGIERMVSQLRNRQAFRSSPKPIVFNEDSTTLSNMKAAVDNGAGWGYHDKGDNDYTNGFQAPPVKWSINTSEKKAFFDRVRDVTGSH